MHCKCKILIKIRLPTLENTECKIMDQFSVTALSTFKRNKSSLSLKKKNKRQRIHSIIALYKKRNNFQKKNVSLTLYKYINRENNYILVPRGKKSTRQQKTKISMRHESLFCGMLLFQLGNNNKQECEI